MSEKLGMVHVSGMNIICPCGDRLVYSRFKNHLRCMKLGCGKYYKIVKLNRKEQADLFKKPKRGRKK